MVFARKVWKLLVAIKDGFALLFLLLFFMLLYAALTARPNVGQVRDGALLLKLDGVIVEEPAVPDPVQQLLASEAPIHEYRTRDLVRGLRAAAKDKRIKVVVLDLSTFLGGGFVSLQEVGAALDEVRAAKKPVLTYATAYADDGLLLAAHSNEAWVDPLGGAFVMGPGGNRPYYARLLEKLKVTAHIFRVGTYKSAVEPYMRNDQSPDARAASQALTGALWAAWQADVAKARPKAQIARVAADPVGWLKASGGDAAKAAQAAGLVDRVGDETAFGQRVAEIAGKDPGNASPAAFAHTTLRTWLAANAPATPGKAIGVVTIAGEIVDGDAGPGTAGGDRIAKLLDEGSSKDFAALVVRVDSPGGSVAAAEKIRAAIDRYRARGVPVIVSMGNLAASGGYWVSTPGSRIFAEPGTITGSIGIFAVIPSFERALADLGVTSDGVKSTPLSGQPDVIGGLSPEVAAMIQANVENGYGRFLALVSKARGKTPAEVDTIAQGRVWDGGTARQIGLVDQFGGLDDALAYAAKTAKLDDGGWHPVFLGADTVSLGTLIQRLQPDEDQEVRARSGDWAAIAADSQHALAQRALADVKRLATARGAQAYCLECPAPMMRSGTELDVKTLLAGLLGF
jgi:protease-4